MFSFADRKRPLIQFGESIRRLWKHCHAGFLLLQQSKQPASPLWLKSILLGVVFITTVTVVGFFSLQEVDPHHDGIMLKPAVDVANGKMVFRDTFSQYGALTILIQALAVKIFGAKLVVIRLLTVLFYGFIASLQWLIYSRILPTGANLLSWGLWLFLGYFFIDYEAFLVIPSATAFSVSSVLFGVFMLIRYLESRKARYLIMSGMATACTLWFKINFGVIHFGTTVFLVVLLEFLGRGKNRLRASCEFILGYCFVNLIFAVWVFSHQSFKDLWIQIISMGYIFAEKNLFSTNDSFLVRVINCLFQIDSTHGFVSALWTFLPIISVGTCAFLFYILLRKRSIESSEKVVLVTAVSSSGIWFTYFPVCSVYHMWFGSALSLGIFFYLLWGITQYASANIRLVVRLACIMLVFYPDLSMRFSGTIKKLAAFSTYERIETPDFLRGIYLPSTEARVYAQIDNVIKSYPALHLINLTRDGLYSLYHMENHEFHKMYVNWGWINTALYQDYLPRLKEHIAAKSHIIITNESYTIAGYTPVLFFSGVGKGMELKSRVVLQIPGEARNAFAVTRIMHAPALEGSASWCKFPLIRITPTVDGPLSIGSFFVRVYTDDGGYHRLNRYVFEYGVFSSSTAKEREELLKEYYHVGDHPGGTSPWYADPPGQRVLDATAGRVPFERYSFSANSLMNSGQRPIALVEEGKAVFSEGENLLDVQCTGENVIEIIPLIRLPERYILTLRINYNLNQYYETTIYFSDEGSLEAN